MRNLANRRWWGDVVLDKSSNALKKVQEKKI